MLFQGVYTALVTPFKNGRIDWKAFETLLENQIAGKVAGVVPVGTTGESPTLSDSEKLELFRRAKKYAGDRCLIVAEDLPEFLFRNSIFLNIIYFFNIFRTQSFVGVLKFF